MKIELEMEEDGRWIAEIPELPGVMVYGRGALDAIAKVFDLGARVVVERMHAGEMSETWEVVKFLMESTRVKLALGDEEAKAERRADIREWAEEQARAERRKGQIYDGNYTRENAAAHDRLMIRLNAELDALNKKKPNKRLKKAAAKFASGRAKLEEVLTLPVTFEWRQVACDWEEWDLIAIIGPFRMAVATAGWSPMRKTWEAERSVGFYERRDVDAGLREAMCMAEQLAMNNILGIDEGSDDEEKE